MKHKIFLFLLGMILSMNLLAQSQFPDFEDLRFVEGQDTLPYRLMKPFKFDPAKKYPLVLFLHGAGERGTDNEITLKHFAPALSSPDAREKYPCFVLVPQCPKNKRWVEVDWSAKSHIQPIGMSKPMQLTLSLLKQIEKKFKIDEKRIYLTGLSMGGFGSWDLIARLPDKFAAVVPVCGGGDEQTAVKFRKIPVWAFHGALDKVVIPERSRNMIEALKKSGAQPKYTEYPEVGHDSWKKAYATAELWVWLFNQKK